MAGLLALAAQGGGHRPGQRAGWTATPPPTPASTTRTGWKACWDALGMVGAWTQDAELIERLPAGGQFEVFRRYGGREDQFPFGRDADGRPAKRWAWTDLG